MNLMDNSRATLQETEHEKSSAERSEQMRIGKFETAQTTKDGTVAAAILAAITLPEIVRLRFRRVASHRNHALGLDRRHAFLKLQRPFDEQIWCTDNN
jgi:hypothetical protein